MEQKLFDKAAGIIRELGDAITHKVDQVPKQKTEEKIWSGIKKHSTLSEKTKRFLRGNCKYFVRSVTFALYKRELITDWIDTLERVVNNIDELSKMDYQDKTANQSDTSPNFDILEQIKRLQKFMGTLRTSADSLHAQYTTLSATSCLGLGLRPPITTREVTNWDLIDSVNIQVISAIHMCPRRNTGSFMHVTRRAST